MKNVFILFICFAQIASGEGLTPTVFRDVRPDILPAAETQELHEMAECFHEENWQAGARIFLKMVVLYRDKMVADDTSAENFIPVSAFCKNLLDIYADRMPAETHRRLQEKWDFFNTGEIPELLTEKELTEDHPPKDFPPTEKPAPKFRCTATRVYNETGRVIHGPLPSDAQPDTAPTFPEHLFYSPETHTLYARMGTPVSWPLREQDMYLAALDIHTQGILLWPRKHPDSPEWAFVGNPLADGTYVYIPMMRQAAAPEFYLAAINRHNGKYAWRRFLFSATPAPETTMIYLPQKMNEEEIVVGNKDAQNVEVMIQKSDGKIQRIITY